MGSLLDLLGSGSKSRAELVAQALAHHAVLEREGVGERDQLVVAEAAEQLGVLVGQRLGEGC